MLLRTLCILVLLAAGAAFAAQVTPDQRARIEAALANVSAYNQPSQVTAEDALVKDIALAPALPVLLAEKRTQLRQVNEPCKCLNHWEDGADAAKLAGQILVLDQAIFRVTYKINPRQRIIDYAHALKFADGRAFTREFIPVPVADVETDRLQRIFPTYRFYNAYLPGYQGGAAPPDELLRSFQVPAPLVQGVNLIAVDNSGRIRLATRALAHLEIVTEVMPGAARPPALDELFQDILPPVKTEAAAKDATYAWLRLTIYFWQWGYQPLAFLPIADADVSATKERHQQITARGMARVAPLNGNTGRLETTLIFDIGGKLLQVTEMPEIELSAPPMPPMSAPPGGGGAAMVAPE